MEYLKLDAIPESIKAEDADAMVMAEVYQVLMGMPQISNASRSQEQKDEDVSPTNGKRKYTNGTGRIPRVKDDDEEVFRMAYLTAFPHAIYVAPYCSIYTGTHNGKDASSITGNR